MKKLLTILTITLALTLQTLASVGLAWDASNPQELVTSYNVYSHAPGAAPEAWVKVGTVTNETYFELATPARGTEYVVTAVNASGESQPSNKVIFNHPTPPANATIRIQLTFDSQ